MNKENLSKVVYSIVSHGQLGMICKLLADFRHVLKPNEEIILVLNIPEQEACLKEFEDLPITIIRNETPLGFGANHNKAFSFKPSDYFVIVNPDIRLPNFDMSVMVDALSHPQVGAVAPLVTSSSGEVEDSIRRFPSLARLFTRVVLRQREPDYTWETSLLEVDWSAGMFVAFHSHAYRQIGGFDDRYFMYMEDADICRRLKNAGWRTVLQPATTVVHDAQRASRRSFRHLRWHAASAFRFLFLSGNPTVKGRLNHGALDELGHDLVYLRETRE